MSKKVKYIKIAKNPSSVIVKDEEGNSVLAHTSNIYESFDDEFNLLRYDYIKETEEETRRDIVYGNLYKKIDKFKNYKDIKEYLKKLLSHIKDNINWVEQDISFNKTVNYSGVFHTTEQMELAYYKEYSTFVKELIKLKTKPELLNNFKKTLGIIKSRIVWLKDKKSLIYFIDGLLAFNMIGKFEDKKRYLANFIDINQKCFYEDMPKPITWNISTVDLVYLFVSLCEKQYTSYDRLWRNISESFIKKNNEPISYKSLSVIRQRIDTKSYKKTFNKERIDNLLVDL